MYLQSVLAWVATELDCLALNNDMPIIVAAVAAHDHGVRANLRAGSLELRNRVADGWVSPAGLVAVGGDDADGGVRALRRRVEDLNLARIGRRVGC